GRAGRVEAGLGLLRAAPRTRGVAPPAVSGWRMGLRCSGRPPHCDTTASTSGVYGRHGSLRRLGQGGSGEEACRPAITGSTRLDGCVGEKAMSTVDVPAGTVWPKDHTGCAPFGAAMVTRRRDPAR